MPIRPGLFTLSVILVSGLLTGAGCQRERPAASAGILHFGNGTDPQDLDPHIVTGVPENKVVNALFEGLVAEGPAGNDTIPAVAERWEISDDERVYTFFLRTGARWSNGDPVTAHDFVRSYQRMLTPALAAEYAYKLHAVVGAGEFNRGELADFSQTGFKAVDDHTLRITLKHRVPYLLHAMKHYSWFPVHIPTVEKAGGLERRGTAWTRPENLVGNGPFVLQSWRPRQKLVVVKSPTYWDRATVKLEEIHFYPTENIEAEERMFRSGQLHKTNELPVSKIDVYKRDFPESYREDPYYGVYYYRLNTTRPPLDDARVRRALALAVDRRAVVENITRAGQVGAYNFCPPSDAFTSRARLEGDLDEARRLLAGAGFPGGQGFPQFQLLFNTSENHRAIAEAIQQMWRRELGITITLNNQEWKVYLDAQDTLNYDISRAGWIGDYPDPATFMDMWVTGGGNNDTGWSHPEYDRLLAASQQTGNDAERFEIYQRMEELLVRELPIIPIYFYTRPYALDPRVRWVPNILDNRNWKFVEIAE